MTDMTDTTEMPDEPKAKRGVNIAPSSMVEESIADWPLHLVIEYLRKKEKDDKISGVNESDCRLFCRANGMRFFDGLAGELATLYGVTRGRVCRWLSYHGIFIARGDDVISRLSEAYVSARRAAISADDPDIVDIIDGLTPYSPVDRDGRFSVYVYGPWVASEFTDIAQVCGVSPAQVAQVYMAKSLLTCDSPYLSSVTNRLRRESERWDKWMRFRLAVSEMAVSIWGAV